MPFIISSCIGLGGIKDPAPFFMLPEKQNVLFFTNDHLREDYKAEIIHSKFQLSILGKYLKNKSFPGENYYLRLWIECNFKDMETKPIFDPDSISVIVENRKSKTKEKRIYEEGKNKYIVEVIVTSDSDQEFVDYQYTTDKKPNIRLNLDKFISFNGGYLEIGKIYGFQKDIANSKNGE